ncbi:MAG: hypothetical protein R2911_38840 [Caldilineaceae bacterium]
MLLTRRATEPKGEKMKRIAVQVADEQKADLLVELLSALTFIEDIQVEESNGVTAQANAVRRFPTPAVSAQRPAMLREQAAFEAMQSELVAQYLDQYVAVFQGKVTDHDADKLALLARIDRDLPDEVVLIRKVTAHPRPPLKYHSVTKLSCGGSDRIDL